MLALGTAGPAQAQRVERTGTGDALLDDRLHRVIAAGAYRLIAHDTIIERGDTVPSPLLMLDARVTVEGVVRGDLIAVDADLFLRPSARVEGDVVNVGGGLYPSALATVTGVVVDRPLARYHVRRSATGYTIVAESRPGESRFELPGPFGLILPTYDRVDGLTLGWRARYRPPGFAGLQPRIDGRIHYRTERGAVTGGAELRVDRRALHWAAGVERVTATNDAWIRGDLENSGAFILGGNDYRDYHDAHRIYAQAGWTADRPGWALDARLRGQLEDASSLAAGDPFVLLENPPYRPNPPVDDGTITSLLAIADGRWTGRTSQLESRALIEWALPLLSGDRDFLLARTYGEWAMAALADHTLEIEWFLQGPLPGTRSLPRQRWSFVGGSSTLNTFEIASFRGDRVVFLGTDYTIPLPRRFRVPILGTPDLLLLHRVGMAWTDEVDRSLEQNVGVRLQFFSPYLRLMVNPADPTSEVDFDIGLSWPFDSPYPWERR